MGAVVELHIDLAVLDRCGYYSDLLCSFVHPPKVSAVQTSFESKTLGGGDGKGVTGWESVQLELLNDRIVPRDRKHVTRCIFF